MAYTRAFTDVVKFPTNLVRQEGGPAVTLYNTSSTCTLTGTRTGEKCLDWKEKIRNGENATTPFSTDRHRIRLEEGLATSSGVQLPPYAPLPPVTLKETYRGSTSIEYPTMNHLLSAATRAESVALSKTYKKLNSELSHMNSAAVLLEFTDVIRQFGKPADAIIDLTNRRLNRLELESRGLKGSVAFRKIKWAEVVASTYLEYAFGLAPLISDTEKAAEALARWQFEKTGEARFRKKIVCRESDEKSTISTTTRVVPSSKCFVELVTTRTTTKARVQYVCGLGSSPTADFGSNDRLLQLLGFTAGNWVPAIWEVVPWSWLLDYFTNVQQILQASVTNVSALKWISKSVTYATTKEVLGRVDPTLSRARMLSYGYSGSGSGSTGRIHRVRTTLTRTNPGNLGVPPMYVKFPSELKQLANMTAVLFARKPSSSALWLT